MVANRSAWGPAGKPRELVAIAALVASWTLCLVPVAHGSQGCVGDCDGDGAVNVNEVVTGINIALGTLAIDACAAFDQDGDAMVVVTELIAAINSALNGCPPSATVPPATATPTALATPEPPFSPTVIATAIATPSPTLPPPSVTHTLSMTLTGTVTRTISPTWSATMLPTQTATPSRTLSVTRTPSMTPTSTVTRTASPTQSATMLPTGTATPPRTSSATRTPSIAPTNTVTATATACSSPTKPPSSNSGSIRILSGACEGILFNNAPGGLTHYNIEVENAPVGAFIGISESRARRACPVDRRDLTCRAGYGCLKCEGWTGSWFDWFDVGNNCAPNATRREGDPATTTCEITMPGARQGSNGQPFRAQADLATYALGYGVTLARSQEVFVDCPASLGATLTVDTAGAIPTTFIPTLDYSPDPASPLTLISASCEPYTRVGASERLRAKITTQVRVPVGHRVDVTSTFPFFLSSPAAPCLGEHTCTSCAEWDGGDTRGANHPEVATCDSYIFASLSRFPFDVGFLGRTFAGSSSAYRGFIGSTRCQAPTLDVEALDANCDYVTVGGKRYQRHRIMARVAGPVGSTFGHSFREPINETSFQYFGFPCRSNPSTAVCAPPDDCMSCLGWSGSSSSCPEGNSTRRADGDPLSAICTRTQYVEGGLEPGAHEVFLSHPSGPSHPAFADRIELVCPPPP